MIEDLNPVASKVNDLFNFRKEFGMENYSIIDVIQEYCFKNDIEDIESFASELSELEGFVEIAREDAIKYKYLKNTNSSTLDEWE